MLTTLSENVKFVWLYLLINKRSLHIRTYSYVATRRADTIIRWLFCKVRCLRADTKPSC